MQSTRLIWDKETRTDLTLKSVLFVINPFLGLIYSLYRLNTRSSYVIFFLFFITVGITMVPPNINNPSLNLDVYYYHALFEDLSKSSYSDLKLAISKYLEGDGTHDIVMYILYFIMSRFTNNYHILFGAIAGIMGYFCCKSMRYITSDKNFGFSLSSLCIILMLNAVMIDKVCVFRFYIAYWISIYSFFKIFIDNNKKYWLLLASTPLFHGSFFVVFFVIALYYLVNYFRKYLVFFVIVSFALGFIVTNLIQYFLQFLPMGVASHYDAYIDEEYVKRVTTGTGLFWIRRLAEIMISTLPTLVLLVMNNHYSQYINNKEQNNMFCLLAAFVIFVNITISVPSLGSRFLMFIYPLFAYCFISPFHHQRYRNWIYLVALGILVCFIAPNQVYQMANFRIWTELWTSELFTLSPVYLWAKYILF